MRRLLIAAALMATMLMPETQALASSHHPTGEFAQFAECPLSNPAVSSASTRKRTAASSRSGKKRFR